MVLNKAVIQADLGLDVLKMTQGLVELIIISFRLTAALYPIRLVQVTPINILIRLLLWGTGLVIPG